MRVRYAWRHHRSDVVLNFGIPLLLFSLAVVVLVFSGELTGACGATRSGRRTRGEAETAAGRRERRAWFHR